MNKEKPKIRIVENAEDYPVEQKDGVYESDIEGLDCYREEETILNEEDGIEEFHTRYVPKNKKSKFFKGLGDRYDQIKWSKDPAP